MLSLVILAAILCLGHSERLNSPSFELFMSIYGRSYETEEEHNSRYWTFYKNMLQWELMNKMEQGTATYGLNQFADLTTEEFQERYCYPVTEKDLFYADALAEAEELDTSHVAAEVDWRKENAVTPVKKQGRCGSCWAFSTTGNVEGRWAIKNGTLFSLSEQELVDCDTGNGGCKGGIPHRAFDDIIQLGGMVREEDYSYTAVQGECQLDRSNVVVEVRDSEKVRGNETQIAAYVARNGPVSVVINSEMMHFYKGGVVHPTTGSCLPSGLDHAVLIVGFGEENNTPYWLIKNSWGPKWGEEGYFKLYRGDRSCGVTRMVTSAIV